MTLQFDDVTVKTIYISAIKKNAPFHRKIEFSLKNEHVWAVQYFVLNLVSDCNVTPLRPENLSRAKTQQRRRMYTKFHCPGIKVQPPPGELIEFFYKRLHFNGARDNPTKSNNTLNNKNISYVKRI